MDHFKAGQTLLNPVLIVFGWRLHEVKYTFASNDEELTSLVLARNPLATNEQHKQIAVQDVLVIKNDAPTTE